MPERELEQILRTGEACISSLTEYEVAGLLEKITGYNEALDRYLQTVDMSKTSNQQQVLLLKIRDNHRILVDMICKSMQYLHMQICSLRNGQKLTEFYHAAC